MIFEIFQNGSDKVNRRLLLLELACDCYLVAAPSIAAIILTLNSSDWVKAIPHHEVWLGVVGVFLSLLAIIVKAVQMFFNKAAVLYKQTKDQNEAGKTETKTPQDQ